MESIQEGMNVMRKLLASASLLFLAFVLVAVYGTAPVLAKEVVLKRTGVFCEEDPNCHNRWHPAIPPVAQADPGMW